MAESLNKITTMLASHLDREQDEPFKRILAMKVDSWRSTLISRSLEKHPDQRPFFRQTLYVPMTETEITTCCGISVPLCKVAASTKTIPTPMRIGGTLFDYVGSVDGLNPFRKADPGMLTYMSAGPYGSKIIYYEYENTTRIIVRQNPHLPCIRLDGVFDNPLAVMEFNCQQGIGCDFWNQPYPITNDILQMVTQYILQVDYNRQNVVEAREVEVNPLVPKNKYEP